MEEIGIDTKMEVSSPELELRNGADANLGVDDRVASD
jgi:hypothetical protein